MTKTRQAIHWSIKLHVAANQNFRCAGDKNECARWALDHGVFGQEAFEIDHKIALSNGGSNHISNLSALCPACHTLKSRKERIKKIKETIMIDTTDMF